MTKMFDKFRADLHCHTTCSDGTETPSQVIDLASTYDLQGLAITDHDTIDAYQEAIPYAKQKKVDLISGIEFSASHRESSVHILGYSFNLNSPSIRNLCQRHQKRRAKRNQAILDLLDYHGMPLAQDDFPEGYASEVPHHSIGRPHIAIAMIKKGYVKSVQEAFQHYIGEGKCCYTKGESLSVDETIEVIHQAQGLAVIAHPHLIDDSQILTDLLQMSFDGIEGYYARFPKNEHERWIKIGAKKGWIITGGSDFHGTIKPNLPLGCSWVNKETFSLLHKHFQENQEDSHDNRL